MGSCLKSRSRSPFSGPGSIVGLVLFLAHLARQIRVETMLRDVHSEADTLQRIFSDDDRVVSPPVAHRAGGKLIENGTSGFLPRIDPDSALATARDTGTLIVVDVMPGACPVKGIPFTRPGRWTAAHRRRTGKYHQRGVERGGGS